MASANISSGETAETWAALPECAAPGDAREVARAMYKLAARILFFHAQDFLLGRPLRYHCQGAS